MSSKDLPQKELIRAYIQNHLKQDHEFQKLAAPIREDLLDTFPDEVEISSERTSFSIPLEKIQSDIAKFQIRRTPRSEQSVEKYISSILKGRFNQKLLSDCLVWYNSQNNNYYILAGHSRLEAQKRLTNPSYIYPPTGEPLCEHPMVKEVQQTQQIRFSKLSCKVTFCDEQQATYLASISNTLGTPERSVDRAMFYKVEREIKQRSYQELSDEFKEFEGNQWYNLINLSYLSSTGIVMERLTQFEENSDIYKDLIRIGVWIGFAKKKLPELTEQHENELFTWLFDHQAFKRKFRRKTDFLQAIEDHLATEGFAPDGSLNLLKLKVTHPILKNYYNQLERINKELQEAYKENKQLIRSLAQKNAAHNRQQLQDNLNSYEEELSSSYTHLFQLELVFDLVDGLELSYEGRPKELWLAAMRTISALEEKKAILKAKKENYLEAVRNQPDLFSTN